MRDDQTAGRLANTLAISAAVSRSNARGAC
jgi:hypothetical protein